MRDPLHAVPMLAVSIAALLFVAWISIVGGRETLFADTPPAVARAG